MSVPGTDPPPHKLWCRKENRVPEGSPCIGRGRAETGIGIHSLVVSQVFAGQHVTSVSTTRALRTRLVRRDDKDNLPVKPAGELASAES